MVETTQLQKVARSAVGEYFKRKFPFEQYLSGEELAVMRTKTRILDVFLTIFQIFCVFGLPVVLSMGLQQLYSYYYVYNLNADETFYSIPWLAFIVCSACLGMIVALGAVNIFVNNLSPDLEIYYNHKKEFRICEANIWGIKRIFFVSLMTLPFVLTSYLVTNRNGFEVKGITALSKQSYRYMDVERLVYYTKGATKDGGSTMYENYEIGFKNGSFFKAGDYFFNAQAAKPFIDTVCKHSGKRVDSVYMKLLQ